MPDKNSLSDERRNIKNHDGYYESKFAETPYYIEPGQSKCTTDPNLMLISKVGSGVVICIHDPEANIGGLLHILMPEDLLEAFPRIEKGNTGFAYIENVIEDFINSLKRHGAGKKRIRIKLYGGSSIVEEVVDSGLKNYVFAKEWLMRKGLLIASEDIGGKSCRRIMFLAHKGKVHCYKMRRKKDIEELREKEKEFMDQVMQQTQS